MLSNFVSKNWRLTSMPMYFGLNVGLAYYKYEIDGIKEHHIKYQDMEIISNKINAIKGKFKNDMPIFIFQTILFGRLCIPLQFMGVVFNHYNYNITTIHEHLPPKKIIKSKMY